MVRFRDISIRNKLIAIQIITSFGALIICCSIFVFNSISTFKSSTQRKLFSIVRIIAANAVSPMQFMDEDAATNILSKLSNEPDIREATLLDKNGKVFASYARSPGLRPNRTLLEGTPTNNKYLYQYTGVSLVVNYKIYNQHEFVGTLIIESELVYLKKIIRDSLIAAAAVLVASLAFALIISVLLQRTIANRLLTLVVKTNEVASTNDYSIRVDDTAKDEIGTLSKEFNGLLEKIEKITKSLNEANLDLEKRVQQRTAELESANKELESFSYTVSHDLKAPLRAINGFTDILIKKYAANIDDKGKEIANTIVANAKKMGQLIEDLLQFSRIGRKEMEVEQFSMDEIVDQVIKDVQSYYEGRNVEIKKMPLPAAKGDKALLVQVWTNLISNAFKYTKHKEKAEITIGAETKQDEIIYSIRDNGAGFDMKYADKLFKVFQRLHGSEEFEGTGVGLAIVARIVARHGGKVWAEAKVDEGATFYFSLPLNPVTPRTVDAEAPPPFVNK